MSDEALFGSEEGAEASEEQVQETQTEEQQAEAAAEEAQEKLDQENDRPDYLLEKYKTVEDQAKAYVDLQKKIGEKTTAPDEYEIAMPDGVEAFSEDVLTAMKDANLTNEQAIAMAKVYADQLLPDMVAVNQELQQERLMNAWQTKTADEAKERYEKVILWSQKHFGEDITAQHQSTASGVMYLESEMKARAESGRTDDLVAGISEPGAQVSTREELARMRKDPRYDPSNPKFDRDFVDQVYKLALATED